ETFKAVIFDAAKKVVAECGVADLAKTLEEIEGAEAIVFDGVVTQRLADLASTKKIKLLVGAAVADLEKRPRGLQIATFDDLA
ncbi:MAG: DNA primase DnaG, partial [Candidatus Thorarchaeota archaeon]